MFNFFEKNNNNFIDKKGWDKGLKQLITDENKRIELTFKCFDRSKNGMISRNDFL